MYRPHFFHLSFGETHGIIIGLPIKNNKNNNFENFSDVFKRMKARNPSPYELFCQFGDEQLIGTSPEMFVRVSQNNLGKLRIESCPISGTIKRGQNAMEDEIQIRALLNSEKDQVELTMCTDVDRNDKSRICEPESIQLISRRSIETYSNLFHTVDHVEGILRPEFDGIDGLLSHLWAVTLTGAPKKNAVQLIENMEGSSRHWYGGAVGYLALNGDINTAITIRTVNFVEPQNPAENLAKNQCMAFYRVGASLVWDSVSSEEVEETKTKSAPFYHAMGVSSAQRMSELDHLKNHKIELSELVSKINEPQGMMHFLDKRLSTEKKELDLILFTAQSLAALINLQKDNITLVSQLPVAKAMFDWVCMKDPKINYGTCDIFYGAYEAGRPKMLGGNPEKGKAIFLKSIENHPHNWLIRTSYIQYYLIPQNDKEGFDEQMEFLRNKQSDYNAFYVYSRSASVADSSWSRESHLRFYQTLALKRFELINKYQKLFF